MNFNKWHAEKPASGFEGGGAQPGRGVSHSSLGCARDCAGRQATDSGARRVQRGDRRANGSRAPGPNGGEAPRGHKAECLARRPR